LFSFLRDDPIGRLFEATRRVEDPTYQAGKFVLAEFHQHDLVVARATAAGAGAIAIVRVDGRGVVELVEKLFRAAGEKSPIDAPREAVLGYWIEPEARTGRDGERAVIDEGITIFFKGPHSFTGNDLAEFQCHGGPAIVRRLMAACLALGARPAQPGEFTRRAYLNGRMDLAQAEAVADLVCAETEAAARAAQAQLAGGLSREIGELRERLVTLAAEIEARIDFPDEGIEEADRARLTGEFDAIEAGVARLIATRERGRLLREGARVALVGPPNVGKSSLLNALARAERAIVTPHPGTTRDTIECTIDLAGVPVTLIDTAGLRESEEPVERIGIERARRAIEEADAVIEVRDVTGEVPAIDPAAIPAVARRIVVENKIDLARGRAAEGYAKAREKISVSAITGEGLDELERRLSEMLMGGRSEGESAIAVSARHAALLDRAAAALAQARAAWDEDASGELVMIDLREALSALEEILGVAPNEAILDRVFERFCIGK
jgi:tRNA modification GTPase